MEPIQIIGIKELDDIEIDTVNRLANRYYEKIKRELKNEISLVVHIKSYEKGGTRRKYSIHVKAIAPSRIFASTKGFDWNLETALHKSFEELMIIIQHRLHTNF